VKDATDGRPRPIVAHPILARMSQNLLDFGFRDIVVVDV
jgi:hypothetical protein